MQVDKKKLARQQIGVYNWFNSASFGASKDMQGTFHYFTGVGKTYTAILIIKRLFRLDALHNIVVLVPSEALQKQWNEVLSKNFTKQEQNRISVFTPHYVIVNEIKVRTNTFIVDELHEYLGEEFIKVINGEYIRFDNNLGLTATYEDSKGRHKDIIDLYPIIDEITEEEALKEGYIAPYVEFNLAVKLTKKEQEAYDYHSKLISENINKFGKGGLNLATKCLSGDTGKNKRYDARQYVYGWAAHKGWRKDLNLANPKDAQINDIWNPRKVFGYAQKLMNAIRERKNILYNCQSKLDTSVYIITSFKTLKTIVFSQSTSFADNMGLLLNNEEDSKAVVYHSNLQTMMLPSPKTGKLIKFGKVRQKRKAIEDIKSSRARVICTASSLDKGFDVQDLALGITASGTSNFTQYKQRGGRVKRIDIFNSDNVVLLVNLYVKDTKDEAWLKKRQSKSNHLIHWVDKVEDINFKPVDKNEFTVNDI